VVLNQASTAYSRKNPHPTDLQTNLKGNKVSISRKSCVSVRYDFHLFLIYIVGGGHAVILHDHECGPNPNALPCWSICSTTVNVALVALRIRIHIFKFRSGEVHCALLFVLLFLLEFLLLLLLENLLLWCSFSFGLINGHLIETISSS